MFLTEMVVALFNDQNVDRALELTVKQAWRAWHLVKACGRYLECHLTERCWTNLLGAQRPLKAHVLATYNNL